MMIGVVSGKAIFGPPLDEYWKKKQQEEAAAKETDASSIQIRGRRQLNSCRGWGVTMSLNDDAKS
ncbi:hypothetical protein Prudu_017389 [Prunus dulcis]|uniref:Uncharacterized protein n=1 Tax=Prunus dulcis TaxID=3755 RepID=A0A4Y1RPL9_PRUDU|nr:hypothetical protein Prudu_017389 [Prunus dulcis]